MNLSELFSFLERVGRRPNRSLSQNFLVEENIARKIVRTAHIVPGDVCLEIGPGPGALTSFLLEAGAKVFAIEKDPIFAHELNRFQTTDKRLVSIHADALKVDFDTVSDAEVIPERALKVVANLPYHITTPLLEKLLLHKDQFSTLTLMVQSELADRMLASPGSKHFSSISLFLQYHTTLASSFKVGSSCFYPRPNVESKVVHFSIREPLLKESAPFFALVRRAFQQRRKMICVSLHSLHPADVVKRALFKANANADARPEELSLEQWLMVYATLSKEPCCIQQ